ncbi:hypothetical protein Sango_1536000 [Sesamum angolense]|uniref:Nucleoside phosphorylase domain-containing protein n=1 Tax=Sesamum angolense TaxID=2727404 RepID=A0AAE2BTA6_9LAMI|nr:hypothetical protein Sango_1536000 [Sesamum angolense]
MHMVWRIGLLGWVIITMMSSNNIDMAKVADAAVSKNVMKKIDVINSMGPYLGVVVPNTFEMGPLLNSPSFVPHHHLPFLDFAGRRFRIGAVETRKVVVVMTGLSTINAGIATQLLLSLFDIEGVVHFGIAGNANPQLQIGDVTIPHYWAHTGLWNWQSRAGTTRERLASFKFSDYNNSTNVSESTDNFLNRVWYQPEEIFSIDRHPEVRQHAFWVPVDTHYLSIAKNLEGMKLERCVNSTCLPRAPKVVMVERGVSANVFVDNAAYREFLRSKFNATPIDMESAAVALVCLQQKKPFIAIRALSDLAGGGSSVSNEADAFASLAAQNAASVMLSFVNLTVSYVGMR